MSEVMDLLKLSGICPIIADAEPGTAVPAAAALAEGGVPVVEVLMRNEKSRINIKDIASALPGIQVGAGSVLNLELAKEAYDLGAKFMVLPGFSRKVVEFCIDKNIPVLPGCVTPTEIMAALDYGIDIVKFFPVYQMGGLDTLKQLNNGPFSNVRFVVTGGLDSRNFLPLMTWKNVLAAGGDWMFQDFGALAGRNYKQITYNIRKSVNEVLDIRANIK